MNPQPKKKTPRSPKYLSFIRSLPCLVCGKPGEVDAHHLVSGGMAIKGPDQMTAPVCFRCHRKLHDNHGKAGHWDEEEITMITSRLQQVYLDLGNENFWEVEQ